MITERDALWDVFRCILIEQSLHVAYEASPDDWIERACEIAACDTEAAIAHAATFPDSEDPELRIYRRLHDCVLAVADIGEVDVREDGSVVDPEVEKALNAATDAAEEAFEAVLAEELAREDVIEEE